MPGEGIRIVFLGTADFATPSLRALAKGPDQVIAVFTPPDRPAGRGRKLKSSPVKLAARELGLPVYQPERVNGAEGVSLLQELSPDTIFVAAYGEILSERVLSIPRLGAINLHASLLPKYRGAAPIQRVLLAGERESGVTVQWMEKELDAGEIILPKSLEIGSEENYGSLHDRLAALGAEAAIESMELIRASTTPSIPQAHEKATYAPPIKREELWIDWDLSATEIARQVRAFSPRPGARTTRGKDLLKILGVRESEKIAGERGIPGRIVEITLEGFKIETGASCLTVLRVQPAGRREMAALDYANGYSLFIYELLGKQMSRG